ETTARRHHVCVQTLHGAASARKFEHTVMLRSRVKSSARAALRAIDRIEKQIVESALSKSNESERQPNQHSDTDHSHHETSRQPASDTDSDHASRMQYQRESSIPLPLRLAIPDQSDQHWNQFIAHCANGMLTEVWGRITSTQDRYFRGDFVHAQMLPVFIGFADPLPPMIVTHLCRQQLNDRDASVFTDWARSLEAIQSIHTDPQLLSCRVPHAALDFQRMGSIPQIALQSGFEKLGQYGALANAEVSSIDHDANTMRQEPGGTPNGAYPGREILQQLPILGYWFQQIPVRIGVKNSNLVVRAGNAAAEQPPGDPSTGISQSGSQSPNGESDENLSGGDYE
ncbi:MAG: hypothetical protein AAFP69_19435, partial [Planctomycetota bacterium]